MDVTAMLPGSRSPAARARRRARATVEVVRHPRGARRGAKAVAAAKGMGHAALQAARHPRTAARTARALPLATLAETAWIVTGTPRRRRRSKRTVAAGAVGVAGAGAATAYVISRRSSNGHAPAATGEPNQGATGGAPGTPPDSGFEPHT